MTVTSETLSLIYTSLLGSVSLYLFLIVWRTLIPSKW